MRAFFDLITGMSILQFVFLCLCVICVTMIICFFLRIFWNRRDQD